MILKLFILCTILHLAHCGCPDGFEPVRDGECRGLYVTITMQWVGAASTAVLKCNEIGGQPVFIRNEEEQSYWRANNRGWMLIGLVCNPSTNKWEWSDGTEVDYKPEKTDADLNATCSADCTWQLNAVDGLWHVGCNNHNNYDVDIYCTTQLQQPVVSADGCDSFEDDSEDGVCYQVGVGTENWEGAQLSCRQLGANLASIHNDQENAFIRRLAVSKGLVKGLYLGATISGKGKEYGWIDGTEWDYENFRPGFPLNGFGECLSMDTSEPAGQWMNTDCSVQLPFACVRDQRAVMVPTCSPGPWEEGELITSPGFPFNSSTPCDYFLIVEAGKKVEVVVTLEANSCCDFLTFYEGDQVGSMIANLTGAQSSTVVKTKTSNIMRVNWQPNGGVNVRGFVMTFRGFLH